jgi:sec-independent protein translocase protein TatB
MFEIGFPELILIAIIGLLVIGPERLPEALRTLGLWVGRMRRSFTNVKTEIEKEIGMDEIRRQLHNEAVMEEMKRIERDVRDSVNSASNPRPSTGTEPAGTEPAGTEPAGTPSQTPDTPGPAPDGSAPAAAPATADALTPRADPDSEPSAAPSSAAGDARHG